MRRKISIGFLFVAMFLTLAHAVLPHHHHGNLICFNPNCLHECECCDDHHDGDEPTQCCCNHHHHDADECTIFAPYVLGDDGRDISLRISLDHNVLSLYQAVLNVSSDVVSSPSLTETALDSESAPPLWTDPYVAAETFRGPPCRA